MRFMLPGCLLAATASLTAQATTGYLVDSNLDQLFTVDLATGAATLIGSTANNGLATPADLSWRQSTQELWTIDLAGGAVGTIDTTNATFTAVYQTGLSGWQGMAWDEVTQLFYLANQNNSNYSLDPVTGVTTLLGTGGALITALDTDVSGNLFGIEFSTGNLVSVDKTTGAATVLATSIGGFQGLGIDASTGTWYGSNTNDDSLHTIDTTTGANTLVGAHGAGVQFGKGFDLIELGANFATKVPFGDGCYNNFASFYESGPFDLSNTSLTFTNAGTYYVVLPVGSGWHTPVATPTPMADDSVLTFALGWSFPYPGGATTDLFVSSNGFITATTNANSGCCLFNPTMFLSTGPCYAALWDDLNPGAGGTVTFDTDPVAGTAVVTFDQVPEYGTSNLNTFQYYFDSTGTVELRYQTCAVSVAGVGWSPGQGNLNPGSIDISAQSVIVTSATDTVALALNGSARPVIGTTLNLNITNVPAGAPLAAMIYSLTKHDPGLPLVGLGMPDCFQYCSLDSVKLIIAPGTTATDPFSVPAVNALAGVHVIVQGAVYNPAGNHNSLGAISSNGLDLGLDVN
ncbi:MAG: hypothetical protein KDC98_20540 [Planctomycetes bacterium]|nr:hypothetical protein [Planctomycetota bacterium]